MGNISKNMPMHPFYFWYHSQDWINEGPVVEGLDRVKDRTWPRPERFRLHSKPRKRRPRGARKKEITTYSGDCRVCKECEQMKPIEEFREHYKRRDGSPWRDNICRDCRDCRNARQRQARARKNRGLYIAPALAPLEVIPSPM